MRTLIVKLGAIGDVVRTTALLRVIEGDIDWLTSDSNAIILENIHKIKKVIPFSSAKALYGNDYDLIINLEETQEIAELVSQLRHKEIFGVYCNKSGQITYTENSRFWFDLSVISQYGITKANELKMYNRRSYQELIFEGLGFKFNGERYYLPEAVKTNLKGDIAIASKGGSVWPMKNWAYFDKFKNQLQKQGYIANYLPFRESLLEHIGDIQNHRVLVSGDSLPMHISLGSGIPCLTIFICTSPWEIYGYGLQKKIVSPLLEDFFYRRDFDLKATTSISEKQVLDELCVMI